MPEGLAEIAQNVHRHIYHSALLQETGLHNAWADIARHVMGYSLIPETRLHDALRDVAGNVYQALPPPKPLQASEVQPSGAVEQQI